MEHWAGGADLRFRRHRCGDPRPRIRKKWPPRNVFQPTHSGGLPTNSSYASQAAKMTRPIAKQRLSAKTLVHACTFCFFPAGQSVTFKRLAACGKAAAKLSVSRFFAAWHPRG